MLASLFVYVKAFLFPVLYVGVGFVFGYLLARLWTKPEGLKTKHPKDLREVLQQRKANKLRESLAYDDEGQDGDVYDRFKEMRKAADRADKLQLLMLGLGAFVLVVSLMFVAIFVLTPPNPNR